MEFPSFLTGKLSFYGYVSMDMAGEVGLIVGECMREEIYYGNTEDFVEYLEHFLLFINLDDDLLTDDETLTIFSGLGLFYLSRKATIKRRKDQMFAKRRETQRAIEDIENKKIMAALPQLDEAKLKLVQDLEIEMMSDMYNRMTSACHKKCILPLYNEPELGKGESVCIDRCIAKYLDIHEKIGKKLTQISMNEQKTQESSS
ncbi:hypothetical protein PV327_008544 [Microctonus hyperodae]|uniref:Tim10-like domain-containing protein n=1 Tax=Microctonus hyperodae TaxID=165561 RepID=A0AA39KHF5_MICHY|nr:hypothetical protein PV327_008544 [Microctonus hyperodae]